LLTAVNNGNEQDFEPVTVVDIKTGQRLCGYIAASFSGDGICGEKRKTTGHECDCVPGD